MAFSELTQEGKKFITTVCNNGMKPDKKGNTLLIGNNGMFPFSDVPPDKMWSCNIKYNGKQITNGIDLANALIGWINKHAKNLEIDANVIAAQLYVESRYRMWIYVSGTGSKDDSTASGIIQMLMPTIYDNFPKLYNNAPNDSNTQLTKSEIEIIINGLNEKLVENSYKVGGRTPEIARKNRPILHQNVINNPEIMIKSMCIFMKRNANNCNSLTSTSLFCYSRGPYYYAKTYTDAIQKCREHKKAKDPDFYKEGVNYVLTIFGILGDKNNLLASKGLSKYYKPNGLYFGYDDNYFPKTDPKNLRLNETWDSFGADVSNSAQYNSSGYVVYPEDYNLTTYLTYRQAISYDAMQNSNPNNTHIDRRKYDNTPNSSELENLKNIGREVYDKIYLHFKVKVYVTTGYRGEFLNGAKDKGGAGGTKDSQHKTGEALDLDFDVIDKNYNNGAIKYTNAQLFNYIANNLPFDQLIWEGGNSCNPGWVHVSLKKNKDLNRYKLTVFDENKKTYFHFCNIKDKNTPNCYGNVKYNNIPDALNALFAFLDNHYGRCKNRKLEI